MLRLVQWKEEEEMKRWDLGFKKKENNIKGNFFKKEWKEDKGKGGREGWYEWTGSFIEYS